MRARLVHYRTRNRVTLALAASLAMLAAACDDDASRDAAITGGAGGSGSSSASIATSDTSSSDTSSSDTSSSDTSSSDTSSSDTSSSASSSSSGGARAPLKLGQVAVFNGPKSKLYAAGHEASASFRDVYGGDLGAWSTVIDGPCVMKLVTEGPTYSNQKKAVGAGIVQVTGGVVPITLTPDAMLEYATVKDKTMDLWSGGEELVITASGGVVPAFTRTAIAPSHLDVTTPIEPLGHDPLPIDRTQDLEFTWEGGDHGSVMVSFADPAGVELECTYPANQHAATIPASALSQLSAGSTGGFAIRPALVTWGTEGDYLIQTIIASSYTWNGVANPQTFSYQASN